MRGSFDRVERRFDLVDRRFDQVDRRVERVEQELRATRVELSGQIESLQDTMIRVGGGTLVGFISVLAAILARGA